MKPDIWNWFDGQYKAHCETQEQYKKMLKWTEIRAGGEYLMPNSPKEFDVILPAKHVKRAAQFLGLSPKKYKNRPVERQALTGTPN